MVHVFVDDQLVVSYDQTDQDEKSCAMGVIHSFIQALRYFGPSRREVDERVRYEWE